MSGFGWTDDALAVVAVRGWTAAAIERLGLRWQGGSRPVGIPIRDETATELGLERYDPTGRADPKMLAPAGMPRALFPPPETIGDDEPPQRMVLLTEGQPDTIAGWSAGLVAVGVPGVQGWKKEYAARFAGRGWTVVTCADCDEGGRDLGPRAATDLVEAGVDVRVVDLAPDRDDGYDLTDYLREHTPDELLELVEAAPPFDPVEASRREQTIPFVALLEELVRFVRDFVVISELQAYAVVLWIAHTYVYAAFDCSPYLGALSPTKRSGKTRLLDVLALLVARPWRVISPSEAVMYRKIARDRPTLLLDEADTIWRNGKGGDPNNEPLRALLNAGNQSGVRVPRCTGPGRDQLVEFETYCPKALAGIGALPDTIADRAVVLPMKRRTRSEHIRRFRRRELEPAAQALRDELDIWADAALEELERARPELPDELDDRAQDAWEPLLAIADAACGDWPRRARLAARELSGSEERDNDSLGVRLLADLRRIFDERGVDRLATSMLLEALHADEEAPWASYGRTGKPLTASQLARQLGPFSVHSRTIRLEGDERAKGYLRETFEDVWQRYVTAETDSQALRGDNPHGYAEDEPSAAVTRHGNEQAANPHEQSDVTALRLEVENTGDDAYGRLDGTADDDDNPFIARRP